MKYLCIANKGSIVKEALTLVGASSKRDGQEYIGMFGSGNKYALAYFLRNNYDVKIYSGAKEISLNKKPISFRDQSFEVIHVDEQPTSITTEMGHQWTLWQAVRELYANAVDEGMLFFDFVDSINPEESNTHIYIEADKDLENFMFNLDDYIATNKQVVFENETGKIYKKHSSKTCIYRKSILCYETESPSIFDYDLNDVKINENRMAEYNWQVIEKMWSLLAACDDSRIAYEVLNRINEKEYIEKEIDGAMIDTSSSQFSSAWAEPLKDKSICPQNMSGYLSEKERLRTYFLPNKLYNHLSTLTKNKNQPDSFKMAGGVMYREIEDLNGSQVNMLEQAYDFIADTKLPINYKWKVVRFSDKDTYGTIDQLNEMILLSESIFEKGLHFILNTIIEEYIHLKYDVRDETRGFQSSIIDEFLSYAKNVNNIK